jgi:hypothetical protein
VSTSQSQGKTGRSALLVVVKGEHKYLFKYGAERKLELFDHLLEYGMDDNYNLTTFDVLALIEKLRSNEGEESVVSLDDDSTSCSRHDSAGEPGGGRVPPREAGA